MIGCCMNGTGKDVSWTGTNARLLTKHFQNKNNAMAGAEKSLFYYVSTTCNDSNDITIKEDIGTLR